MLHFLAALCALFVASLSESNGGRPPVCSAVAIHIRQVGYQLKTGCKRSARIVLLILFLAAKEKHPPKKWIILASAGRKFLRACNFVNQAGLPNVASQDQDSWLSVRF